MTIANTSFLRMDRHNLCVLVSMASWAKTTGEVEIQEGIFDFADRLHMLSHIAPGLGLFQATTHKISLDFSFGKYPGGLDGACS